MKEKSMLQKNIIYVLMMGIFLSSCSMFNWTRTPLNVMTSEHDAKIYINGEYMGEGHVQTRVPRHTDISILVKKDGFLPAQRDLTYRLGTLGTIDVLFGCVLLIPFIGVAFPGAYVLDQENVSIVLEKK